MKSTTLTLLLSTASLAKADGAQVPLNLSSQNLLDAEATPTDESVFSPDPGVVPNMNGLLLLLLSLLLSGLAVKEGTNAGKAVVPALADAWKGFIEGEDVLDADWYCAKGLLIFAPSAAPASLLLNELAVKEGANTGKAGVSALANAWKGFAEGEDVLDADWYCAKGLLISSASFT
jgi:hypothetical protein